jgi:DNA-binding Xre family transcriptional regulator
MKPTVQITKLLNRLHYAAEWVDYGFVDETFLTAQMEAAELSGDESTEHYRYAAFKAVLESNSNLDDLTIDRFIKLAELDEDQTMAEAALALLARNTNLTDEQLERIRTHRAFTPPALQKILMQNQLLRSLDSVQLTDDVFERCLTMGNGDVQRKLVARKDLSANQLMRLMTSGSNRAVRNLAKQQLHKIYGNTKHGLIGH